MLSDSVLLIEKVNLFKLLTNEAILQKIRGWLLLWYLFY